jgi:hypothetical protein
MDGLGCRQGERLPLAQGQESGEHVDIAARQQDVRDRRRTEALRGVQERRAIDLLAQIRRGIQDRPVFAISAYSQTRLRASGRGGVTQPRPSARHGVGIPLRKTAPCGRAQHDRTHLGSTTP